MKNFCNFFISLLFIHLPETSRTINLPNEKGKVFKRGKNHTHDLPWCALIDAAVSEPEANERGSSLIRRRTHFLRNARDCGHSMNKSTRNCGYARMEELRCEVRSCYIEYEFT